MNPVKYIKGLYLGWKMGRRLNRLTPEERKKLCEEISMMLKTRILIDDSMPEDTRRRLESWVWEYENLHKHRF